MNKWEEKRTRPVLPIYLAALVWPVGALLLPAYRLSNLLIIAGLSLAAYGLGTKFCPTRVIRSRCPTPRAVRMWTPCFRVSRPTWISSMP